VARAHSLSNASAVNRARQPRPPRKSLGRGYEFAPWAGPPPGTYDPGIRAQVEQSERGLLDLIEEQERTGHREGVDTRQNKRLLHRNLAEGLQDIRRQRGNAEADAANREQGYRTTFARDIADLATARQQGTQDYERTLGQLQQKYAALASVQAQARIQSGTSDAGTTAASQAVDAANQGYEKGGIDLTHQRNEAALDTREARDREDLARELGLSQEGLGRTLTEAAIRSRRLNEEARSKRNQLELGQNRNIADRATELSRAKREQALYAEAQAQQAFYAAHKEDPKIVFPTPAATQPSGGAKPAVPKPLKPAISVGHALPNVGRSYVAQSLHQPHVLNPVPSGFGRHPARSVPLGVGRRPYTRF
jgi:hypothetical protein